MRKEQTIHLSRHQPTWQQDFNVEKGKLKAVLGDAAIEIEHIGSTSIEGLLSKPIIDIAVMIESHKEVDGFTDPLAQIGYNFRPKSSSGERHFYTKGDPIDFHLSIAYADRGGFWPRQIMFRDYLRSNREARDEYTKLKEEFFKYPSATQSDRKADFVYRILRLAGWKAFQMYKEERSPTSETYSSVIEVVSREDCTLIVSFDSGEEGLLNMKPHLGSRPFQEIASYEDFKTAHVSGDTIEWDCGVALDPEYVYHRCTRNLEGR